MHIFRPFLPALCILLSLSWAHAVPAYLNKPVRVFIFSGQSNMAGSGNVGDAPEAIRTQPQVLFDESAAGDAATFSSDWEDLGGPAVVNMGPEFAAAARFTQAYPDHQICIIKVSRGATGLGYWRTPGQAGHDTLMGRIDTIAARLNSAVTSGSIPSWSYAGFLWMQGENEADGVVGPSLSYATDFNDLVTKVRTRTGVPTLPVVLGRISNLLDPALGGPVEQPQLNNVRAGQVSWATNDGNGAWVDTDNLSLIDSFHFGSASQLVIGQRFAEAWFSIADSRPRLQLRRAVSQENRSASPAVLYTANFSAPVTGFDPADIAVLGSTGAAAVTVNEASPFNGTSYEVRVRGMIRPGMVNVAVGNGAAVSGTALSLPALAEATEILWTEDPNLAGLIAYDPMEPSPRVLRGSRAGTGWRGSGWSIQNDRSGYTIESGTALSYPSLLSTPGYARGGDNFVTSARLFDLENAFRPWMTSRGAGAIDLPGSTLWVSYLVRADISGRPQIVSLNRGTGNTNTDSTVTVDQNAGNWRFAVLGTQSDTGVSVVTGQTYLMVLKLEIGGTSAPSTAQLWINPASSTLGKDNPPTPTATHTVTSGNFKFSRVVWYPGSGTGNGCLDEFRLGTSYASVTPRVPAALTAVESAVRQHFASAGKDHLPVENFDPDIDFDGDELTGAEEVLWSGNAANAGNTGNGALTLAEKRAPQASIGLNSGIIIDVTGPYPLPAGFGYGLQKNPALSPGEWTDLAPGSEYALTILPSGNGLALYRSTLPIGNSAGSFWRAYFSE